MSSRFGVFASAVSTGAIALICGAPQAFAAEPAAKATVTVDPGRTLGPIKPMNAVNNGPSVKHVSGDMKSGNDVDYQLLRIPAARIHDMPICDINRLFPDFDADETKPENYDFVFSDRYLDGIRSRAAMPT